MYQQIFNQQNLQISNRPSQPPGLPSRCLSSCLVPVGCLLFLGDETGISRSLSTTATDSQLLTSTVKSLAPTVKLRSVKSLVDFTVKSLGGGYSPPAHANVAKQ